MRRPSSIAFGPGIQTAQGEQPAALDRPGLLPAAVALAGVVVTVAFLVAPSLHRLLFAAVLAANLVGLALRSPRLGIVATFAYLPLLGLVRRLLIPDIAWSTHDPLLLVGPAVALVLFARLILVERRGLLRDPLARLVAALLAVAVVETLNPNGGGLLVGAGGLLFLGIPLVWFFVGHELADGRLVRTVMGLWIGYAVVVAAYGLYQTQVGYPSWDREWLSVGGYSALHIGNAIRAVGTFSSASEYLIFLGVGIVFALAFARRRPLLLLVVPFLAVALFLGSGRTFFATTALAAVVMAGLYVSRGRWTVPAVLAALVVAGVGGIAVGSALKAAAASSGNALIAHQAGGLGNPFDRHSSTLLTHVDAFRSGVERGFTHPLGQGTGATNISADKLGGSSKPALTTVSNAGRTEVIRGTDIDISNVFVGLGFVGGLLYVAAILLVGRRLLRRWAGERDPAVLATIGLLIVSLGQWLTGGHYAVSPFTWLLVGWAARPGAPVAPAGPSLDSLRRGWARVRAARPHAGGAALTVATSALMLVTNFGTGVLLARSLGAAGRGATAALLNAPQIVAWLFALGSVQTISYFQAREPGRGDRLLGTWLALTVPLGLVTIVVGELLIPVVFSAQSAATVQLAEAYMVTSVLIMLNWTVVGFVLGEQRFTLYNVVRLASPASVAVAYLVLWLAGALTVSTAVWSVAVLQLAFTLLLLVLAVRRHGLARPDRALARETLWYGLKSHGANVSGYLNARLDLLIMPAFLSASSVGLYSVATNVSWIVFVVPGSVSALVLPLAARQDAAAPGMVVRSMWGTLALAAGLAAVIGLLAGVAVRAVYGAEFLGCVDALRLLLPGSILYAAAFCPISGLYGANRPFTAAVVQAVGLVVSTAGLLLFLESGGIEAAAIVSTLAYALVFVLAVVVYRHVMNLRWRDLLPGRRAPLAVGGTA